LFPVDEMVVFVVRSGLGAVVVEVRLLVLAVDLEERYKISVNLCPLKM